MVSGAIIIIIIIIIIINNNNNNSMHPAGKRWINRANIPYITIDL